ncbi:MAG: hypothetical protein AAGM84_11570 [Pseudomonadota bacterium]
MSARWPWSELGLDGPVEEREVKRAYAARLKQIDRSDPEVFGNLRRALDAAKAQAKTTPAKRPRMADIAQGAPRSAPPASPNPLPLANAQPPNRKDSRDTHEIPDEPVVVAEPEKPKPAKRRQPPVPPKPAARPWGAATSSLDTLLEEDPIAAEDAFWAKLRKATSIWPWDVATLDTLLSLDLAHDLQRRRDIEHQLYDGLRSSITSPETGYAQSVASLIERQFGWAADGVGLRRRLGYKPSFEVMMHGHAQSLPKKERPRGATVTEPTHKWTWYKAGVFVLLWLVSMRAQPITSAGDLLIQVTAVGILLWFASWITKGLVMIVRGIGRLTRLAGPARGLFARAFPETDRALDRNAQARSFAMFVLAAVLSGLLFLAR